MVPVMPLAFCCASSTAASAIASGGSTISGGISMPPPPACQPSVSTTRDGLRQLTAMLSALRSAANPRYSRSTPAFDTQ